MPWPATTFTLCTAAVLALSGCAAGTETSQPGPAGTGFASPAGPLPSPSPVTGGAPGSTVTGRYLEREAPGGPLRATGGGTVGLYPNAFQIGPNAIKGSEGNPVAVATIGPDGVFTMMNVPSGVWFLARIDGTAVSDGRWVEVTPTRGAAADLIGCRTCPPRQ